VPAGRKADDSEPLRIDPKLGGSRADQPHRPLRVLERDEVPVRPTFARKPVGEHEHGGAPRVEVLSDVDPLILHRQKSVAAAGKRQQSRAVRPRRAEDVELGRGHSADP
jgi:hypothetical protein